MNYIVIAIIIVLVVLLIYTLYRIGKREDETTIEKEQRKYVEKINKERKK